MNEGDFVSIFCCPFCGGRDCMRVGIGRVEFVDCRLMILCTKCRSIIVEPLMRIQEAEASIEFYDWLIDKGAL